jgi:hypothetical protein
MGVSTYASVPAALSDLAAAGYTVTNTTAPPNLVTSGSVFYVNAGLIMSYPRTNSAWYDISGNTNNGTLTNGPTFDSIGAIVFDGTNDYVNCGNASNLQITVGTIGAWVKTSTPGGSFRSIIAKQNAWGLFVADSVLVTYDWGNAATRSTGINIADGTWKYVAMTFTETSGTPSNNAIVYLNGNAVLTTTVKNLNQTVNVQIAEANANQFLNGSVAAAHVYNRVLSTSEILQNYYQGNIVTSSLIAALDAGNLVSYPGSGTTWYDLSGNGNHFTLYNGVAFSSTNGGYLRFDGTNDYAASNSNINLSSYDYIAIEIFYQCNNTSTVGMVFEHTANWNTNAGGLGMATNTDGNNNVANCNHTNHNTETAKNYLVTNNLAWNNNLNLYSKISDSTGRLTYVNGNLVSFSTTGGYTTSTATTAGGSFANAIMYLGSRGGSTTYFNGNIASIKIYGFKINSTQVLQNFNAYKNRYNL